MKIVHIAFLYGIGNAGGAAIGASRLHQALLAHGIESHYVCVRQREKGTNVHVLPHGVFRLFFFGLRKIARNIVRMTFGSRSGGINMIPLFGLEKALSEINPDVVHVHWLNADVCSFEQLAKLPYGMIFSLHDLYMLLPAGGHPGDDRRYVEGLTQTNSTWIERYMMRRKKRLIQSKAESFVGPSNWVCEMARHSIVGNGVPAYVIPNVIDELFFEEPPNRKRNEKFVILFGAYGGRRNVFKGFPELATALARLPEEVKAGSELRIFGEEAQSGETGGVKTVFLGEVKDPFRLREIYRVADILVFPSVQETQGMVKIEAMLCGLAVVAFNRTACAEGIAHQSTGWIASDGDCQGFSDGISHYFSEWKSGCYDLKREEIARKARADFATDELLREVENMYQDVLSCRRKK